MSKREIKAEETEEAAVRSMKNYLKNLKEQVKHFPNPDRQYEQCSGTNWIDRTYRRIFRDLCEDLSRENSHYMEHHPLQALRHHLQASTLPLQLNHKE